MTVETTLQSQYTMLMPQLSLTFLGTFDVRLNGKAVVGFRSDKVRALLIYLALEADRPHPRLKLAGLLWPDWPDSTALAYLRHALTNLRHVLGDREAEQPFIQVAQDAIQFNQASSYWLDVTAALRQLSSSHPSEIQTLHSDAVEQLQQAVALYRGPLLDGFSVADCPAFEEWLLLTRERLHRQVLAGLTCLVDYYEMNGAYSQAQQYAWRCTEIEPSHEKMHCALMRLLALSGQTGAALTQFEVCRKLLAEILAVEPMPDTVELYQQILSGVFPGNVTASPKPTLAASPTQSVPQNLPTQATSFIGRKLELAMIASYLQDADCRLLTLLGPGGIGKTRLALQVATEHSARFRDGVHFVPLVSISSPELIPTAIVDALHLSFYGATDIRRQLLNYLSTKQMLLILDNFEQLLAGIDFVRELLEQALTVTLLITSRVRLNLSAEWLFTVKGLDVPDASSVNKYVRESAINKIEEFSAIRLFIKLAQRMRPELSLSTLDATVVARICRLVEGMPLGIQLATGWLRVLPCHQIAQQIAESIDFLTTSLNDVPERHRSIKAVFEHSWRLLNREEQTALTKLAVFRSGFRQDAAEIVAKAPLNLLLALTDKSFVQMDVAGRYQIHELLRQFILDKLAEMPMQYQATHDQYCAYFLTFLHQRVDFLTGHSAKTELTEVTDEFNNIYAAWIWAIEREHVDLIGQAEFSLWQYAGLHAQQTATLDLMIKTADMLHRRIANALKDKPSSQGKLFLVLIRNLIGRSLLQLQLGNAAEMEQLGLESISLLRRLDFEPLYEKAWSLCVLGWAYQLQGKAKEAWKLGQESLELFHQEGGPWERGQSLLLLGSLAYAAGSYTQAEDFFSQHLASWRAARFYSSEAYGLYALANIARAKGDYAKAERLAEECYKVQHDLNDLVRGAYTLCNLGHILRSQARYEHALQRYHASLKLAREYGLQRLGETCLYGLGCTYMEIGDYAQARHQFEENIANAEKEKGFSVQGLAASYNGLGNVTLKQGSYAETERYLCKALQMASQSGAIPLILDILLSQALLLYKQQHLARAAESLAFVQHHPATKHATKEKATQLLAEVGTQLSAPQFAQAKQRGGTMQLEDLVNTCFAV
ncbi:MAG: BTAD domain-containing putative transcriptional regulator [Caldilineaceae bacterium]